MAHDLHIAVIGAGAMGGAFIGGLLRQGIVTADHLVATDTRAERRHELTVQYGIAVIDDNAVAASKAQVVIVAVKPQVLPAVLPPLRGALRPGALCLSIVAGATTATFTDTLQHPEVVRSIPNTPAQIGEGMTVWTAAPAVTDEQMHWTRDW
ncbi:MAG: NAD(P)-binding domain-containing protein, partial [Chloroflexaceae bacterium]|nr:NAD(P)-binding domain-containing protein [Chloroflexaceae bacterium]